MGEQKEQCPGEGSEGKGGVGGTPGQAAHLWAQLPWASHPETSRPSPTSSLWPLEGPLCRGALGSRGAPPSRGSPPTRPASSAAQPINDRGLSRPPPPRSHSPAPDARQHLTDRRPGKSSRGLGKSDPAAALHLLSRGRNLGRAVPPACSRNPSGVSETSDLWASAETPPVSSDLDLRRVWGWGWIQPSVSGKAKAFVILWRPQYAHLPSCRHQPCQFGSRWLRMLPFFFFFPRRGKGHGFALIKAMTGLTKSGSEMEWLSQNCACKHRLGLPRDSR